MPIFYEPEFEADYDAHKRVSIRFSSNWHIQSYSMHCVFSLKDFEKELFGFYWSQNRFPILNCEKRGNLYKIEVQWLFKCPCYSFRWIRSFCSQAMIEQVFLCLCKRISYCKFERAIYLKKKKKK